MKRDYTPDSVTERLFGVCVGILMAALALYGAVWLVCQIWKVLAVMVAVVILIIATLSLYARRRT